MWRFSVHLWCMDWIREHSELIALLGIALVTMTMFRMALQRIRKKTEREQQREIAIQAAQDAERKEQLAATVPKLKVPPPKTRAPLGNPLGTPFTGGAQGVAAQWEAEVHQIGRQIIGQIDCKMAALQAITVDANRTANRLEMLVEHLEQIARKQTEWQQQMAGGSAETSPTIIPAAALTSDAVPLTDALQELTENLTGFRNAIRQSTAFGEQPEPVTVLRLSQSAGDVSVNLRDEAEMLSNYGLDSQEIARRLNISIGEVDLILQVQQSRSERAGTTSS